jgi:hypothetical protein
MKGENLYVLIKRKQNLRLARTVFELSQNNKRTFAKFVNQHIHRLPHIAAAASRHINITH